MGWRGLDFEALPAEMLTLSVHRSGSRENGMPVFSRDISVDIEENPDESLLVKSHMEDIFHDILVYLTVSRPDFIVQKAEIWMERIPSERCREVYPVVKQLEGVSIKSGFTSRVTSLLGGGRGCPNVVNLVLVGAPLALNASWLSDVYKGRLTTSEFQAVYSKGLDGVCIAHTGNKAEDL